MRAVGLHRYLPSDDPEALLDLVIDTPAPGERDLLVAVHAVSVNPVDTKVRRPRPHVEARPRVLGWDVAGVVEAVGPAVTLFRPGDAVYYAGSITRPGGNSEYHLVDERIVGPKPRSLDFAGAAALPLTAITAWEGLFDRLGVVRDGRDRGKRILIIGGAGGVGSVAIQLAKRLVGLEVIATASRQASAAWCRELGADVVIDHFGDLPAELAATGAPLVDYIFCLQDTDRYWVAMTQMIAPQGKICSIVETRGPVDVGLLQRKSASFAYELMFTRAIFETPDMIEQHRLLSSVAELIDAGSLRATANTVLRPISADNLRRAHAMVEGGRTVGKIVLAGWE
ncbi:MAG: zinc-binding alcohol dehydrogenase family protein [Myxococcales bacterium]|nr:zinc-binding alcohol dehydrogenase family protein [Myxococcales bacterium]